MKAALSKASRKNHTPIHKSPDIPLCHSLVEIGCVVLRQVDYHYGAHKCEGGKCS